MEQTDNGRRPRRSFTEQYKAEVVDLCRHSGKSMAEIARSTVTSPVVESTRTFTPLTQNACVLGIGPDDAVSPTGSAAPSSANPIPVAGSARTKTRPSATSSCSSGFSSSADASA